MKKLIAVLILVPMVLLLLPSCGSAEKQNPERPDVIPTEGTSSYDLTSDVYRTVAESGSLILQYNDLTTDIAVTNKNTGYRWSTEYSSDGSVYRGEIFTMDYYTTSGMLQTISSVTDSIEKGQFTAQEIDGGIKVQYGLGDVGFKVVCPLSISQSRAEQFLEKMSDEDLATFNNYYQLIDFDDPMYENYDEEAMVDLEKAYPLAVNEPWYYPYGSLDYYDVDELNQLFARVGYTEEDAAYDNRNSNTAMDRPEFSVSIYYTLQNDKLTVRIPESELYSPDDYTIDNIKLHPGFLDFDMSTQGYFLLPDGSGSIMEFNNGRESIRSDAVYINLYGIDEARGITEKVAYYNDAVFPVYGACIRAQDPANQNGVLTIVENGETFAGVVAHPSDGVSSHNVAYLEFRVDEKTRLQALSNSGSDEDYTMYQFQRYQGDLQLSYNFLSGTNAEYTGMAKVYEQYLFGDEAANTVTKDYYSTVEMVGVINGYANLLGIEYNNKIALTTYEQVGQIAKDLQASGFNNMNVKLSGWSNGGLAHGYVEKIKPASQMGTKEQLTTLISDLKTIGIDVFPDADVQYVYDTEKTPSKGDQTELLTRQTGMLYDYDPVYFYGYAGHYAKYILNMDAFKRNLSGFLTGVSELGTKNVSLRNIGAQVNANYDRDNFMDRQETLENLLQTVQDTVDQGYTIMGSGGIGPFTKYLDVINNLPLESAGYDKCDYSVPFTAMVLSGHTDYTSKAINLSGGERSDLLRIIESGAGAYFTFTGTYYDDISGWATESMYSTVYDDIKDMMLEKYQYLQQAMQYTYGQKITNHQRLAEGVYKTTYQNGYATYVNYTDNDYQTNGVTVRAQDYLTVKEG